MTAVVDMTAGMAVVVDKAAVDRAAGMAVVADKAAAGTVPAHHFDCLCQINCCCPSISPSDISLINMKRITDIIISQDNTFVQQILTKNFSNNSKILAFLSSYKNSTQNIISIINQWRFTWEKMEHPVQIDSQCGCAYNA